MTEPGATPSPHLSAARAARGAGALVEAARHYEAHLSAHPKDRATTYEAAEVLRQLGDTEGLAALFKRAAAAVPEDPFLESAWIEAILNLQRPAEAVNLAEQAISGNPHHSGFHALKGLGLQALGRMDDARAAFWAAHEADPKNIHALFNLVPLEQGEGRDRLTATIEKAWTERPSLPAPDRIALGYARGRLLERAKDFDEAFASYAEGAREQRALIKYNEPAAVAVMDNHMRLFPKARLAASPLGQEVGSDIVFVVSLPRSGSTLIEQILASHSACTAIGERDFVTRAFDTWYAGGQGDPAKLFTAEALRAAGDDYRARAEAVTGKGKVIIDKTIGNSAYLGFLSQVFPGARIIHAVRDPMDTAFSCFATLFYFGQEWTYDFGELARAIRRYQKFMAYWMRVLPKPIHHCRYEALIADPETEARALLEACGLPWEDVVLEFHMTERAVSTASVTQVRQPLYQTAKGRAGNYGANLDPLRQALGRAADPDWFKN